MIVLMNKNQHLTPQQQAGVMYQIYPRSFKDSNDDGIGDLQGIISKLDYLHELGVNSVWLSPIYPSPMADFGYDISDYCDIDPRFGTLDDFDQLVRSANHRGLKIVMDYVLTHTSIEHPWFQESISSKINPKRDWFIWADPAKDGGPPNNWMSIFGGPGWTFDEVSGQYYLHSFLKEQPQLNWRNPEVIEAMMDVLRFWIDRGVDGFRTDAFAYVLKDPELRDEPLNPKYNAKTDPDWWMHIHTQTERHPDLAEIYQHFDDVFNEYPDKPLFMVTEDYAGLDDINWHYEHSNSERFAPLNLAWSELNWDIGTLSTFINSYLGGIPEGSWPNYALGNHDLPRAFNRIGEDSLREAALLYLTLPGIPIIYYGDEIGMQDVPIPKDKIHDPRGIRDPHNEGRDPQRTPMQWDSAIYAGFSEVESWLPIAGNADKVNVAVESEDPNSLLNLYKNILSLRATSDALQRGSYTAIDTGNKMILGFQRSHQDEHLIVLLNFSDKPEEFRLEKNVDSVLIATDVKADASKILSRSLLTPYSGVMFSVAQEN